MSSLIVTEKPWRATPGNETTIEQLQKALDQFPQLVLDVMPITFEISFSLDHGADEAPDAGDLSTAMFGEAEGYVIEDSGVHAMTDEELSNLEDALDSEARDRFAEEDQDLV